MVTGFGVGFETDGEGSDLAMVLPSPQLVANRTKKLISRETLEGISQTLRASFPTVVWTAEQAGVEIFQSLTDWVDLVGSSNVADWVDHESSGYAIATRCRDACQSDKTPLLGRLVQEEQLSKRASDIAPYMRAQKITLEYCLLRVRVNVANSAFEAAFDATWERRTIFARTLRLARSYLQYIVEAEELLGREKNLYLMSKLGMATVWRSRFSDVSERELREACETLLESQRAGNENSLTHYLEGCAALYDAFDDRAALESAGRVIVDAHMKRPSNSAWNLNSVDIWTKLAGCADSDRARLMFLAKAREAIDWLSESPPQQPEDLLRFEMQDAFVAYLANETDPTRLKSRGVRLPFALRNSLIEMPESFARAAESMLVRLRASPRAGSYLYRDVTAELVSFVANLDSTEPMDAIRFLAEAIALRNGKGSKQKLRNFRAELAQAEDMLRYAVLSSSDHTRMTALLYLASNANSAKDNATRLTVLAREVETNGAYVGALLPVDVDVALEIRNGNSRALYERAAREAIASHDISRVSLGGRGGVIALRDSESAIGQTFVFKLLSKHALARDRKRTALLTGRLVQAGLSAEFGLVDQLATMSPAAAGLTNATESQQVSVRRFSNGQTLQFVLASGHADAPPAIARTVKYLAFIQAMPMETAVVSGVRRTLWECEMGRWLRPLVSSAERPQLFADWWSVLVDAPSLPRRDAHAMNWLVESGGKILAVDLESTGWRPFGYELAQLTEDTPYFAPEDWTSRFKLLDLYVEQLESFGARVLGSNLDQRRWYGAGVLARAVRTLSNPADNGADRERAGAMLGSVERQFRDEQLGTIAASLAHAWRKKTGMAAEDRFSPIADAARKRISRAMSYQLRHNASASRSKDGWVHAEELASLLNKNGHRVTAAQLRWIAGALGEQRFELDEFDIRALYGHSTDVAMRYEQKKPPDVLYHATPLGNLASIFEAQSGLKPGARKFVHLTDSILTALTASKRQGRPVAVLAIDARALDGLVFASGQTWLTPSVPLGKLEVVTVRAMHTRIEAERMADLSKT